MSFGKHCFCGFIVVPDFRERMEECLRLYARLSVVCSRIGLSWTIFGLITIVFGVYLSFRNRISNNAQKLAKLRGSSFIQGAMFLIFAVLLDIG